MGLFKKLRQLGGNPSAELMANGRLGRGVILGIEATPISTGPDGSPIPVCKFTVEVTVDGTVPYQVECRQGVSYQALGRMVPGQTVVAVRVSPQDPSEIALDLNTPPPPSAAVPRETGAPPATDEVARKIRPSESGLQQLL